MKERDPKTLPLGMEHHRKALNQIKNLGQRQRRTERKLTPGAADEVVTNDGNKLIVTKKPGKDIVAPHIRTTDFTVAALANLAYTTAILTLTMNGDINTDVDLDVYLSGIWITAGLGNGTYYLTLWDGAIGSGTLKQTASFQTGALSTYNSPLAFPIRIDRWAGSKTFNVALKNLTGVASDFRIHCGSGYPGSLSAKWGG